MSIVDGKGDPVRQGEQGEVVVRGACVFDGYDGDPTANVEAFFDDWYRTGDVGVFDQDGYLHLVGRIKEMINRGGQKVSPVDVDAALVAHPEIADAAAFAVAHPILGEVIGAAVVLEPHSRLQDRDIIDFLRDRLEPIKWPRTFVFVERIPRGSSGKVRRYEVAKMFEALDPALRVGQGSTAGEFATLTEARLAQLWKWLLQKDRFGPDDDFFLAGGDSLAATQLVLTANEVFDVELRLEAVFGEAGTIRTMAACIDELRANRERAAVRTCHCRRSTSASRPDRKRRGGKSGEGNRNRGRKRPTRRSTCSFWKRGRVCAGCDPGSGSLPSKPTRTAFEAPRFPFRNRRARFGSPSSAIH